jgi:DNA (cytosine-5)-methyltransferase 1
MAAYYNENDPHKVLWLRELIKRGCIAPGDVDSRPIQEVRYWDLALYDQCHFFAGIGAWSYALRLAGIPDSAPVWSGSCPCPSFSAAGKGRGFSDARHLWPEWSRLIGECRPAIIFGEQVDAAIGHGWLDLIQSDLEAQGYAVGKAVLGACSVGAPHRRQRLWFVAKSSAIGRREEPTLPGGSSKGNGAQEWPTGSAASSYPGALGNNQVIGRQRGTHHQDQGGRKLSLGYPGPVNGFWSDAHWLYCTDNKYRPAKSGIFPLAHGSSAKLVRLRGYGDAIVPEVAAAFIKAAVESIHASTP